MVSDPGTAPGGDMHLDHVAVAVRSVDLAAARLAALFGYTPRTTKVTNTRQMVNVLFLAKPGSIDIKLIEPSSPESPLVDFVRKGGGLHHVCFRVPDVAGACADLASKGARVIAGPEPGEAFGSHDIAFVFAGLGLNVELVDTDERHAPLTQTNGHASDE